MGVYGRRAMTLPALTCGMLSGEHRDLKGPPNNNSGRRPPPLLWARRSSDGTTRSRNFRQVPFPSPRCPAPMTGCALRARKLRFGGESGNAAPHRTKEEGCRPTAPTGRSGTVVAGLAATSPSNAQQRSGTKKRKSRLNETDFFVLRRICFTHDWLRFASIGGGALRGAP